MTIPSAPGQALHLRATVVPEGRTRDVYVVAGRITFTEPDDARTVLDGGYLVPGLVDAHAHLSLHSPAGDEATAHQRCGRAPPPTWPTGCSSSASLARPTTPRTRWARLRDCRAR